jgi:hypothetical protein
MAAIAMTDPLRTVDQRQRRDVRMLYRTLADAIGNAVDRLPGERDRPVTEADRAAIMREVDAGLDVIWGQKRGAESAVRTIVTRDTRAARLKPLDAAVTAWRRAMPQQLWARVKQEAVGDE